MNPSARIREIADLAGNIEVRRRLEALAAEFEVQHNQQNNNFGIALGRLQLSFQEEMDILHRDIAQEFGDNEVRQKKILEMMEELQREMRALPDGTANAAE